MCLEGCHFFRNYVDLLSKPFKFHLPLLSFISPTDIIGVLRDFEVPHACDSGTSSILFGWHKSAGHSSLVHSGVTERIAERRELLRHTGHLSSVHELLFTQFSFWP